MTEIEAQKLVTMLATAFPAGLAKMDPSQQDETQALYCTMLADLPYQVGNAAVVRVIATHRYPSLPLIADVRRVAEKLVNGREPAGHVAWGTICELIRRYGVHRTPGVDFEIPDPMIASIVESFGWRELCSSTYLAADRARVIEAWDRMAEGTVEDRVVGAIAAPLRARSLEAAPLRELIAGMVTCDGEHGAPACAHPECWQGDGA